jgi:hypothetical protein
VRILSDRDVLTAAFDDFINGAESYAEDWIDEEGDFTDEDADRVFDAQMLYVKLFRGFRQTMIQAMLDIFSYPMYPAKILGADTDTIDGEFSE